MRNSKGQLIIGLCGSTIGARRDAAELFADHLQDVKDVTISGAVRAAWRRGDHLLSELAANDPEHSPEPPANVVAMITCREEAAAIEKMGGHVIHVEGNPSDDIAIKRDTILLTFKPEGRGRYTTISETLALLGEVA